MDPDDTQVSVKEEPHSSDEGDDEYAVELNDEDGNDDEEDRTAILPYENNLMLDSMHDDILFITARGLGLERLFYLHLHLYCSRRLLVLVINTHQNDEHFFLKRLKDANVDCLPNVLNSDISTKDREALYLQGGVQFVTSRILMVDLLTGRIPVDHVSGVLVYRAHALMTSFQESFILRLLREKKPDVFVKAFSDSASAIAANGLGHLQRLYDKLYVRRVRLLPRFDVDVKLCFEEDAARPELIEIRVDVPRIYRKAIVPIVDIIRTCVRELKQCSQNVDAHITEPSSSPFSGITPTLLEIELRRKSLTLTEKQQRLLNDISQLRQILEQFQDLDAVTTYRSFKAIRNNKDLFNTNSGWVFTRTASQIFTALEDIVRTRDSSGKPVNLAPAKWTALASVLDEIRQIAIQRHTEGTPTPCNVVILTSSGAVCNQIADLLKLGINSLVSHLLNELADEEGKQCDIEDTVPLWEPHRVSVFGIDSRKYRTAREGMLTELVQEQKKAAREGRKRRAKAETAHGKQIRTGGQTLISDFGIVHYKKMKGWPNAEQNRSKCSPINDESSKRSEGEGNSSQGNEAVFEDPQILILPHGERYNLINHLDLLKPEFVIFYNMDLSSLRIVETFKAVEECPMRVYSLMYKESTEEDYYYSSVQREQLSFERLLREQMVLLVPREYNVERDAPPVIQKSTRDGRAVDPVENPKVIVDVREFNSELPTVLYKKGIDLIPSTLEVGDYILSDDVAVERKALDDLTQSLHSGRVFKQTQQMISNYKHSVLLIESREKFRMKMVNGGPFQGELSRRCRETRSLFCVLLRSNPQLHCLWSLDPNNTAELFEELKMNQKNPDVDKALAIKSNDEGKEDGTSSSPGTSKEADGSGSKAKSLNGVVQRQLIHIPGLAGGDVERIMRSGVLSNVYDLATASENAILQATEGNEIQAQKLSKFFSMDFRYL